MSNDTFGPDLKARLRGELDRVQPRFSAPRYLSAPARPLRLAPAFLGASVIAILALSAFVATGSPNPIVWGERVVTVLEPIQASPSPGPENHNAPPAARPSQTSERESPKPNEGGEAEESPAPRESPEPSDGPSGEGSSSGETSSGETSSGETSSGEGTAGESLDDSHDGSSGSTHD
jgi:hypothetical protein